MDLNLSSVAPQLIEDPYPLYAILRETQPVAWVEDLELFLVTRHADVRRVLSDPVFSADFRHGKSAMQVPSLSPQLEALSLELSKDMLRSDGAVHRRRRSIVARAFTPRVVRDLVPRVEKLVQELLDQAFGGGRLGELRIRFVEATQPVGLPGGLFEQRCAKVRGRHHAHDTVGGEPVESR